MSNFKFPSKKEINSVFYSFSKKERIIFVALLMILIISTISILQTINKSFMVTVPLRGGSVSLGVVGVPRFVNPILASGEADQDLVALIYSGLLRKNKDGVLIPDLAEKHETSPNGLTHTFTLKDDLYFHDGKPLTADDVVFTIGKVKDSVIQSPRKVEWDGVSVEKIDDKNIKFTLHQPYSSFLENTTLGILPAHIWDNSPVELNDANTNPIGSGPYMVKYIDKQSSGIIDSYKLVSFDKFILGEAHIKNMSFHFYQNENDMVNALITNKVEDISSITPLSAESLKGKNYKVESVVLPRIFGLFFNQNVNQLFTNKVIVSSINQVIDKEKIVRDVLLGYGTVIDSPIPPNILQSRPVNRKKINRENVKEKVRAELAKDGWKTGTDGFLEKTATVKNKKTITKLAFSISTGNVPELVKTAELIKQDLAEVGINVEIKTFEKGNLNQNVIRPRKYDTLLFGEIINHESDLFAFWHSSQRKDPGLNVAIYTNAKVDKILEDAFVSIDETSRINKYQQFEDEIRKDTPAVFLYSPDFIYVVSKKLKDFEVEHIISPSDRYLNMYLWYIDIENIWKIFVK